MKTISMAYGQVLFDLHITEQAIQKAEKLMTDNSEVVRVLENPIIAKNEKEAVIDHLFPRELRNFMKVVCDNGDVSCIMDAFEYYQRQKCRESGILKAEFYYVTMPKKEQIDRIEQYLMKKYQARRVELKLTKDVSLVGGFVLRVGDDTLDNSLKGKMDKLQQSLIWR